MPVAFLAERGTANFAAGFLLMNSSSSGFTEDRVQVNADFRENAL